MSTTPVEAEKVVTRTNDREVREPTRGVFDVVVPYWVETIVIREGERPRERTARRV